MFFSSIDIGTNTIRLLIAEKSEDCKFRFIFRKSSIARLGENLEKNGYLSEKAIGRALGILEEYKRISEEYHVDKIFACATSAVREAENGSEFLKEVSNIGIGVRVIDSQTEAFLTHRGIVFSLGDVLEGKKWVAFDLGGGSTEFMFSKSRTLLDSFSVPFGVVKLLEKFVFHDPPLNGELETSTSFFIDHLKSFNPDRSVDMIVANAGTVTTLVAIDLKLEVYSHELVEGYRLRQEKIDKILAEMLKLSSNERLNKFKILEKGREDVIVVGTHIVMGILRFFNKPFLVATNGSLREGLLFEELCSG